MKKKPTTNAELAEQIARLTELVEGQEKGYVVEVDRQVQRLNEELQRRNAALMLMLYGAAAKFGVGFKETPNGIVATAQLPVLQMPANHQLDWEVSEDGKTVLLYIVLINSPEATAEAGQEAIGGEEAPVESPTPDITEDEFEDAVTPGLDEDGEDGDDHDGH